MCIININVEYFRTSSALFLRNASVASLHTLWKVQDIEKIMLRMRNCTHDIMPEQLILKLLNFVINLIQNFRRIISA